MYDFTPFGTNPDKDNIVLNGTRDEKLDLLRIEHYGWDKFLTDEDMCVRRALAKEQYRPDVLVSDPCWEVRATVADYEHGLDILVNDEHPNVRKAVAEQGYGLDKLINDENKWVRAAVAEHGYGLDKLINDPAIDVRWQVAEQGYGLDILAQDENEGIRELVAEIWEIFHNTPMPKNLLQETPKWKMDDDETIEYWINDLESELEKCKTNKEQLSVLTKAISNNKTVLKQREPISEVTESNIDTAIDTERLVEFGEYLKTRKQEISNQVRNADDDFER